MRNRYFARSEPGSDDQPLANAARAAATALSTSSADRLRRRLRVLPPWSGEIVSYDSVVLEPLAADEEPVAIVELDDVARLGRRCVSPILRDGCAVLFLLDLSQG